MPRNLALDRTLRIAACFSAILAAGCGGGGGDEAPAPQYVQITTDNQVAVARATAAEFASLGGAGDLPIFNPANAAQAASVAGVTKHALGTAVATARVAEATLRPLAVTSIVQDCDAGGTLTITLDDRDNNNTPSSGDVMTIAFNDCRTSESSSANGSLSVDIASFSETQLNGLFTFNQLTAVDGDSSAVINGAANCAYSETLDQLGTRITRIELTVAGNGLVAGGSTPSYSDKFTHDPGFTALWSDFVPSASAPYSTTQLNGTVHVESLAGRIILATDPPVHDWWSADYPDSGQVLIHGYRSHLRMTALNTALVRLELDANDDATWEGLLEMPWSDLMP